MSGIWSPESMVDFRPHSDPGVPNNGPVAGVFEFLCNKV